MEGIWPRRPPPRVYGFCSRNILPIKPEDIPSESHVQKKVTVFLGH